MRKGKCNAAPRSHARSKRPYGCRRVTPSSTTSAAPAGEGPRFRRPADTHSKSKSKSSHVRFARHDAGRSSPSAQSAFNSYPRCPMHLYHFTTRQAPDRSRGACGSASDVRQERQLRAKRSQIPCSPDSSTANGLAQFTWRSMRETPHMMSTRNGAARALLLVTSRLAEYDAPRLGVLPQGLQWQHLPEHDLRGARIKEGTGPAVPLDECWAAAKQPRGPGCLDDLRSEASRAHCSSQRACSRSSRPARVLTSLCLTKLCSPSRRWSRLSLTTASLFAKIC